MSANDIIAALLANAEIASQRRYQRAELRQPFVRNWGVATGARPYRRSTSSAVGWWVLVAAVAVCAIAIMVAI